ncbi:MAG: hypothetical protein JKY93_03760 [Gammaproteobacteria bacterium]|nr:hypothetical protein [Gammaproteobacteria bacterium]
MDRSGDADDHGEGRVELPKPERPCDQPCKEPDKRVPIRVHLIDRIVEGIAVTVRANPRLGDLKPVGLDKLT